MASCVLVLAQLPWLLYSLSFTLAFTYIILSYTVFRPGLKSIPGPVLAKFTDLWRLKAVKAGNFERTTARLHKEYGDIVRIGPNTVIISDPTMVESIYGLKGKSKFYNPFMAINNGRPVETFFTTQNVAYHSAIKRPISSAYSMTTITDYEPHINIVMNKLLHQLEERYCTGRGDVKECNIGEWLHYYSFDVILEMTWSSSLGFLDHGSDIDGMIQSLEADMDYFAPVGQMPWIDNIMRKNPFNRYILKKSSTFAAFGARKVLERRSNPNPSPAEEKDFLSKFLKASKTYPQIVDNMTIVSCMVTNLVAGSDTTAISLRAVLYYLLKHPACYKKLQEEVDHAELPKGPVSWSASQKLLYLDAYIKEAFRMHPAVGLPLERVVPKEAELRTGLKLPTGTIVGISAWSIHRRSEIFGDSVDEYVPERWLQQPGEDNESFNGRLKRMKRADFSFGYRSRTCLGKNIGLVETYKTISTIIKGFKLSLVDPNAEWSLKNAWFVRQTGLIVYLRKR
ncbi:cytochrome P450 [Pyrenochaeta sp. DS3sAY3a]|nr:cytochrome P450 [Pyrenochaeta sp. DS3sAY3a]